MLFAATALSVAMATSATAYTAVVGATLIDVSQAGHSVSDTTDSVPLAQSDRIVALARTCSCPRIRGRFRRTATTSFPV